MAGYQPNMVNCALLDLPFIIIPWYEENRPEGTNVTTDILFGFTLIKTLLSITYAVQL